ncbi:LicD family protein [Natronospira bacteriovora]|uniref:LicD family protein n=1 Tax=Natronospira bacteriovora TaxID=3069753 RepID=A0ABU0W821_9GAMM|nr:LicD family protein [Natronospira sp. AB-CW4]MDQ2069898.1 LicD family protein [Natronospira sp. AB-CW4]
MSIGWKEEVLVGQKEREVLSPFLQLADALSHVDAPCWLDSGSLLGLVREGGEIEWDSDIDLGLWASDRPNMEAAFDALHDMGFRVHTRRYRGEAYGYTLKKRGSGLKPIHIHVYFRDGRIAWSPQTVVYHAPPSRQDDEVWGTAGPVRWILSTVQAKKQGVANSVIGRALRKLWWRPLWGAFVLVRNRLQRHVWSALWPFNTMYRTFTWIVPAAYFLELDEFDLGPASIKIPSDVEAYLQQRYGDWRVPVRDWCYWQDDGCIDARVPEEALARRGLSFQRSIEQAGDADPEAGQVGRTN